MQGSGPEQHTPPDQNMAMPESCKRVKIHLLTGDLKKLLLSRPKYAGMFCATLIGHRHAHLVDKEHKLRQLAVPGGVLAVETVKNMLQLSSKQVMRQTLVLCISCRKGCKL